MLASSTLAFRASRPGFAGALHASTTTHSCRGMLCRASFASPFPAHHPFRPATRLKQTQAENKYKDTIILPSTRFDLRANATATEPSIQKWWQENKIYEKLAESNPGEPFVLHDGPPYANGDLHIGHAMNKILKDFINRYHILQGRKVKYVPGWDCHGLPIEMKVLQSMKQSERQELTPVQLREKATEFAKQTIDRQKEGFMRYGVWGYWDKPYRTLDPEYEAKQISVFGKMVLEGHIYRGKKPVHWSPSSKTALAEAELEYPDNHISRSIYVGFDVTRLSPDMQRLATGGKQLRLAIWTTTPWTIPANMAVAVNANIDYSIVEHAQLAGVQLVVAKDLVPQLSSKLLSTEGEVAPQFQVVHTFKGAALEGTSYRHPFAGRESQVVIGGDYITTESGTGLVHTAPGHGVEDFAVGQKYGLEPLSPVDGDGKFTPAAGERFVGMSVLSDGNAEVITALQETSNLLKEEAYNHKYPYDWRTKKPTIFRVTEQWFASVDHIRELALKEVDRVQWIPAAGRNRIASMLEGRSDWCISRQRVWGVPIPVFYHKQTGAFLMTKETLSHIEAVFHEQGSDAWWKLEVADLLPPNMRDQAHLYEKGTDTMDVWFDSGSSWCGVLESRQDPKLKHPADMYLEGSDQHRGWFQSALLTSVATRSIAPFNTVLTHGFVLDEQGRKMSKSLGNVINPQSVIDGAQGKKKQPAYGADVLRLWVSSVDYSTDVSIGDSILSQVAESYRKLRNTARYMLGNLHDFDPKSHAVPLQELASIDKYVLGRLSQTVSDVEEAFQSHQFNRANLALTQFAISDLSSFYFDASKDRLYVSSKDSKRRRSCQTTLYHLLDQFTVALSPILPHLAEEIWSALPYEKPSESVFGHGWVESRFQAADVQTWETIRQIRSDVNKCMDVARKEKSMGANMEAVAYIYHPSPETRDLLRTYAGDDKLYAEPRTTNYIDDLRFVLMTSQVKVLDSLEELRALDPQYLLEEQQGASGATVGVSQSQGQKCDRCWYRCASVGTEPDHPTICSRCAAVMRTTAVEGAHRD